MKHDQPSPRTEWTCLGLFLGLGFGGFIFIMMIPTCRPAGSALLPLLSGTCGFLAMLFLGLHMTSRFRRKWAHRTQLKKTMAEIVR